jgi:gentisate 1,2-dioxygenase
MIMGPTENGTLKELNVGSLDALHPTLHQMHMLAGWTRQHVSGNALRPFRWSYAKAKSLLDSAGKLMGTEVAERRNLILTNPADANARSAVRTIMVAYQMILPGERARTHRHTANALRLVLNADAGAYTVVNGEKLPMWPGDVLLRPDGAGTGT